MIGVKLPGLLEAEERRIDHGAARIEDDDLLLLFHRPTVRYGRPRRGPRRDSGEHPEPGGDQIVCDCGDGGKFHASLRASSDPRAAAAPSTSGS